MVQGKDSRDRCVGFSTGTKLPEVIAVCTALNAKAVNEVMIAQFSRIALPKVAQRLLLLGLVSSLTTGGIVLVPAIADRSTMVVAQDVDALVSNDELFTRYVRAAFAIERQRRSMMGQVKELTGGAVPGNVCAKIGSLPAELQEPVGAVCTSFARYAEATVSKRFQLSKDEFNAYQRLANNPAMRDRVAEKIQALGLK
jgi:hypothetical protein